MRGGRGTPGWWRRAGWGQRGGQFMVVVVVVVRSAWRQDRGGTV